MLGKISRFWRAFRRDESEEKEEFSAERETLWPSFKPQKRKVPLRFSVEKAPRMFSKFLANDF